MSNFNIDQAQTEVKELLESILPKTFKIEVSQWKAFYSNEMHELKIAFCPVEDNINQVRGQHPQLVSLLFDLSTNELNTQIFGGFGGGTIYREIDKNNPNECYLAMKSEKVPFRKPKKEYKFCIKAIERFANNYLKTLKKHESVLRYKDMVDYSFLDNVKL